MGDLGRARPSVWHDDVLPKAGEFMSWRRDEPVSHFPLTDDEQELRNRAWLLIMPAASKDNWESRLIELRRTRVIPAEKGNIREGGYGQRLIAEPYRSSAARYERLALDVENDRQLIPLFFAVSARVREADRIREGALNYADKVKNKEWRNVEARITENEMLVWWVHDAIQRRAKAYRYALEHLMLATPDIAGITAERAIMALEADIKNLPESTLSPRNGSVVYGK